MPEKSHKSLFGKTAIVHILHHNTVSAFLVECKFLVGRMKTRVEVGVGIYPELTYKLKVKNPLKWSKNV